MTNALAAFFAEITQGTGHVATTLFDLDLHVELAALRQMRDHVIRIDDLDVVRRLNISRSHHAFAFLAQRQGDFVTVVQLEHHALEVEQHADHIFLQAVDHRVLVEHAVDADLGRRVTHQRRQHDAAQRVAKGVAVAARERFKHHFGTVVTERFDLNRLGAKKCSLHKASCSIPSARYADKAEVSGRCQRWQGANTPRGSGAWIKINASTTR
ncbi:hypothetical protein GALL_517640 [mine drainage metagenome]|uniref:Uncharacterized protein n=1 Tax=mine drainage metagenome TaxID=410659 RepID=A0A1J5P542_9ZZZZ